MNKRGISATIVALALSWPALSEDGYDLWLRYRPLQAGQVAYPDLAAHARALVGDATSPTLEAARSELARGLGAMAGAPVSAVSSPVDGALVFGTPRSSGIVAGLKLGLERVGDDGFVIRSVSVVGVPVTVIAANSDIGVLYGAFHFLKLIQTRAKLGALDVASSPRTQIRVLNHWDNLDRHVERGFAGQSIWDWHKLPAWLDPRYTDYARACASLGINGSVLTNVNANATSLTPAYLEKAAALAGVFRPYGVRVYLTARFSAPMELGGLKTADPLDPAVRAWWKQKADEIYRAIPDFGGFLVKANSEGQPGPQDYKRTHADGANMLAAALGSRGNVIWRAFVYSSPSPTEEGPTDRAKQAFDEFTPLDGKFAANVLVQVKNGAIDFQPREPFHPLFGAMPKTPLMMEFQITKEYLGFATHLAYLGPLFEEALDSDTMVKGPGSTVAKVVDGDLHGYAITGMAGVANVGADRNWSGSDFDQANWYAFGRLAWNPELSAREIAEDWVRMTFSNDAGFVEPVVAMMMRSREAVIDYMMPLGLAHLFDTGHHFGPGPWVDDLNRADWNPTYYHRADVDGVGFARGPTGSGATHLLKVALEAATGQREHVAVYGTDYDTPDGTGIRDFIHVTDLVRAHTAALDYLRAGGESTAMNAGYGRGYSVLELLDAVQRVSGRLLDIRHRARRAGDMPLMVAAAEKIRKTLAWEPRFDDIDLIVAHALTWEKSLIARRLAA
ncbi:MAG: NAD-dependent epimerase/dehydratase family protein [Steroidobacteraceae bacterium]|nr:NAD-dependent epimerase/dehydratase family protein [Steroidobacteraceae bacterium]